MTPDTATPDTASAEGGVDERVQTAVRPGLRLLGGDGVVCEGDSCFVPSAVPAQD